MIKPANELYRPGDRTRWLKYKRHTDTPVIVAGITGMLARPESLIVARHDSTDGGLRVAGRTAKIGPAAAAELSHLLTPPPMSIRGPTSYPPAGSASSTVTTNRWTTPASTRPWA